MSPNSNGFYKSKIFKFVNKQYQKISEKSIIAIRYLKIALEWALQTVLYSAQMLIQTAQKIGGKITGKDREVSEGEKSFASQTKKTEIAAASQENFLAGGEKQNSLLDFKESLSTPVARKQKTENKQAAEEEIDYQELEAFTQELRQELDVYLEKDGKPENLSRSREEKVARTEEIEIEKENWIKKVNIEEEARANLLEENEEEISWLKKAAEKTELLNSAKAAQPKQEENWLEEIEEIAEQTRELEELEEKIPQEISNSKKEFSKTTERESEFKFEELEDIAKQTTDFQEVKEAAKYEVEREKEEVNFEFKTEIKQAASEEATFEVETETSQPLSEFARAEIRQEEKNLKEETANGNNLAIVPTKQQKKLIPTVKEYLSDLLYIATKLAEKLGDTLKVAGKKATENLGQRENLENTLEKGKIIFQDTAEYIGDKFSEYSGKIKAKIEDLDLKGIDLNKSLNLGKEGQTNLELKSYILSGIQNYVKDIDIAYKEIQKDSEKANEQKRKISPDWLETKATSLGYVKQPLEVILTLLDRALFWIEEILAAVWFQIRKIIAKIKDKR